MLPSPRRLTADHEVDGFRSGQAILDRYLAEDALAHGKAGFSLTWVIPDPHDRTVWGYVSLAAASQPVKVKGRSGKTRVLTGVLDTCPYPEVPVVEIGHIATRRDQQGKGIASDLLTFAMIKVLRVSEEIGVAGIILYALTPELLIFYMKKLNFEKLPYPQARRRRMLLTIADARATAKAIGR